ncbi:hypothetical protein GCM10023259_038530 [Thermocatellispora tengchongensis]
MHPGQQLDQGGLAGAVAADKGVHLARGQGEGDVVQRAHALEALEYACGLENRAARRHKHPPVPTFLGERRRLDEMMVIPLGNNPVTEQA